MRPRGAPDRRAAAAADEPMDLQRDAELLADVEALFADSDSVVIAAFKVCCVVWQCCCSLRCDRLALPLCPVVVLMRGSVHSQASPRLTRHHPPRPQVLKLAHTSASTGAQLLKALGTKARLGAQRR